MKKRHLHFKAAALLQRHPLVTLPAGAGTTRLLDDWLLANCATVQERIVCNSWGAVAGMLRQGVGGGFLPAYWVRALNLRAVGARTPLAPLHYAFQWRRGDARALITAMQPLAQAQVDFSVAPAFAGAMSL